MHRSLKSSRWISAAAWLVVAAVGCGADAGDGAANALSAAPTSSAAPMRIDAASLAAGSMAISAPVGALPIGAAAGGGSAAPRTSPTMNASAGAQAGSGGDPRMAAAAGSAGSAGVGASSAGTAPTLTQIYEMLYTMKCAACHSMAPNDNQNGKLGMLRGKDQLYEALVNKPAQGSMCMGKGAYVVPGDPAMSLLIQKLSAKPPCGSAMPLGGMLEPAQVEMIRAWIAAGAINN